MNTHREIIKGKELDFLVLGKQPECTKILDELEEDYVFLDLDYETSEQPERIRLPKHHYRTRLWDFDRAVTDGKIPITDEQCENIYWCIFHARCAGVRLIVTRCFAGQSRSAAVAAALSEVYNGDSTLFHRYYSPNSFIETKLLNFYKAKEEDYLNNAPL